MSMRKRPLLVCLLVVILLSALGSVHAASPGHAFVVDSGRPETGVNAWAILWPNSAPLQQPPVMARQQGAGAAPQHARRSQQDYLISSLAPAHNRGDLVAAVSATRTFADITLLATIQAPATTTRRTGTAGQQLARDWLKAQFESLGYVTALQAFSSPYGTSHNVIAEIAGRTRANDVYLVGGHYDSTSPSAATNAPGAEDNASGTAGTLEMARILAQYPPQATVRFVTFAGEEQGMVGSEAYVNALSASERARIKGAFIMDMIGYKSTAYPLNVLLESRNTVPGAVNLVNTLSQNAQAYTTLNVTTSYDAWGSDHVSFLDVNLAAVLLIEQEYDSYSCYHRTCDTPDKITPAQAAEVLKMLIAALDATAGTCLLGDVNCDGLVSAADIVMIAEAWGGAYDRRLDLNHDNHIDIVDVMLAAAQWQL